MAEFAHEVADSGIKSDTFVTIRLRGRLAEGTRSCRRFVSWDSIDVLALGVDHVSTAPPLPASPHPHFRSMWLHARR